MKHKFCPDEIIFSVTNKCNLKCPHCYVEQKNLSLDIEKAKFLIKNSLNAKPETEWRIGFTGGEPFLNLDFLCQISKFCVENNIMFDRIMTNALWWETEDDLQTSLTRLYESGYDGKIGISLDSFHGGDFRKTAKFIFYVTKIWQNPMMCEIQATYSTIKTSLHTLKKQKNIIKLLLLELERLECDAQVRVDFNKQVFSSDSPLAWKDKKWFREDFCVPTGNIFYVHTNGSIAPCCGYSNENEKLIIGTVDDDYETLLNNVQKNRIAKICFETGLENWRKTESKCKRKLPGKTSSPCTLCDFVCRL